MSLIPERSDKIWLEILQGEKEFLFKFIATKILVGRLKLSYKNDASPEKVELYIEELIKFFETNQTILFVKEDLETITKKT